MVRRFPQSRSHGVQVHAEQGVVAFAPLPGDHDRPRAVAPRGSRRRNTGRSNGLRASRNPAGSDFSGYPVALTRTSPLTRSGSSRAKFHAMLPPSEFPATANRDDPFHSGYSVAVIVGGVNRTSYFRV